MSKLLGFVFRESREHLKQLIQRIGSKALQNNYGKKTESKILSWWIHQLRNSDQQILIKEMGCKRRSVVHHRSGKTVGFCGFVNIQSPNSPFEVPCSLYFSVANTLCLKKWRAKGVLQTITKVAKLLLSVGSSTFRVQILHSKFHAHFIPVSSIHCV